MAIAKPLTDASQKKEKKMYEDNLAEFLNYCDEEEDLCAICLCKLPDVRVINNCCQQCDDSLVAELEDYEKVAECPDF
jgi:hypothetical protein